MSNKVDYNEKILEVKELRQYFKVGSGKRKITVKAIDNISFDVYKREVFGLVGESGSGKTTTGRTIIKLYEPTGGTIKYKGNYIGYGYESLLYDIRKIRKQTKLDIINQNPYRKALYENKVDFDLKIAKNKKTIKLKKQNLIEEINNARNSILEYDNEIYQLRRRESLEIGEVEKNNHIRIQKLRENDYRVIVDELSDYIKGANVRLDRKVKYLLEKRLDKEEFNNQYNTLLRQFMDEINFTYDLIDKKINSSEELITIFIIKRDFDKMIRRFEKIGKNKKINEENSQKIQELIANWKQKIEQYNARKTEINLKEYFKKIDLKIEEGKKEVDQKTKEIREKYRKNIENIQTPSHQEINNEISKLKANFKLEIDALKLESKKIKANFIKKRNEIKTYYKNNEYKINYETINEIKVDASKEISKKRKELIEARRINKLKESKKERRDRQLQISMLKKEYNDRINLIDDELEKKAIQEELVEKINEIEKTKVTYENVLASMQMIFQDPISSLNPRMTVREIIGEGIKIHGIHDGKTAEEKIFDVLEMVGLRPEHADRYPHEFSGGQRQRIGIARALIINPEFIIADEPISALDVSIQAQVINLLNDLKNKLGLTILFVAHDLSVVKYFSDRIAVMNNGKIIELANSDELFSNPLHPYTKSLLSAIPQPNPEIEKTRKRIIYNPSMHDYSIDKPEFHEIKKGHFVYANKTELEMYKKELKQVKKNEKDS